MPTTTRIRKTSAAYRLKIVDENSFEEIFSTDISRGRIYIFLSTLFVGSVLITLAILLLTPLKYYIPGYGSRKTEKEAILLKHQIDSLGKMVAEQQTYTSNIKAIINGKYKGVKDTTLLDLKKVTTEDMRSILPKAEEIKKDAATSLKKMNNGK